MEGARFAVFCLSLGAFAYGIYGYAAAHALTSDLGPTAGASGCVMGVATYYLLRYPGRTVDLYGLVRVPFWFILAAFVVSDVSALALRDGIPQINHTVRLAGVVGAAFWWLLFDVGRVHA